MFLMDHLVFINHTTLAISIGGRSTMGLEKDSNQNEAERPLLLLLKGRVYDVAQFAPKHPGGEK
ncbi:hypothetical protein TELCIR_07730, partial [Teladorsagia circumcincta]